VRAFLDRACEARGDAPFLVFRGRRWSYAETGALTDTLAAELVALGIAPGDRLALHLPTGPEHLFLWLATAKAGIVSCPLHFDLAAPEIEAARAHLRPRGSVDASGAIAIGGTIVAQLSDLMASHRSLTGIEVPQPEAIATILTTSGTTGRPKAAMLSHRMAVLTGEGFCHWLGLTRDDRLFTCLPLSHINARFYSTLGAVAVGASLALEERFSASRFWSWVRETNATQANAIGAMLKILLDRATTTARIGCASSTPRRPWGASRTWNSSGGSTRDSSSATGRRRARSGSSIRWPARAIWIRWADHAGIPTLQSQPKCASSMGRCGFAILRPSRGTSRTRPRHATR
jgi:acyl-CoA synthetase (AMP-forming)/AMP-acid ligase II